MPTSGDHNLERLIGTLIAQHDSVQRQLARIEAGLEKLNDHHDAVITRVVALEMLNAQQMGSRKAYIAISGVAATIGGFVVTLVSKYWPNWFGGS